MNQTNTTTSKHDNASIQHSRILSSELGSHYRKKILISISVIGLIVSSAHATLLWTQYQMILSSVTDVIYALCYAGTLFWIKQDKLTSAAYWLVLVASLQVTLGTIFFVGAETGFQLYFLTLPVVVRFLLNDQSTMRKLCIMVYGCLCFIAGHTLRVEAYMAPIPSNIAEAIFIVNSLIIFSIVIGAVKFFSDEVLSTYQQQNKLVLNDALTGIANTRFIEQYAHKLLSQADRYGRPMSLVHFDLDDFNLFNQKYGHEAGNQCLKAVVKLVEDDIRDADILARIGADEFIILLPETGAEETKELVVRLGEKIQSHSLSFKQESVKLSARFGLSYCDSSNMKSVEQLILEAKS